MGQDSTDRPLELPCTQCERLGPATAFGPRGRVCLECRRANARDHYRNNRDYYLAKARRRNAKTTASVRAWLMDYLALHPCVDCGVTDIRVLEFDHRDPGEKRAAVSVLVANGYSLRAVQREVAACEVRCANCHIIRTRKQFNWWRAEEIERARHDSNVQPFDP